MAALWLGPRLLDYGAALEEIEFQPHYRSRSGPRETLERMYREYHQRLATLPSVTYRRSRKTAEIRYECRLMSAEEAESSTSGEARFFPPVLAEMAAALELLRNKLRPADGFDLEALLSDTQRALREAPTTSAELEDVSRSIDETSGSQARQATDEDERMRRARPQGPTRPLQGIRIFHGFGRFALEPYDFVYAEVVSNLLRRNGLRTSDYKEIYIRIDQSLKEAVPSWSA